MIKCKTLPEYLSTIQQCNDINTLEKVFKIYDNWPVLLFGNQEQLFNQVTSAFNNSPNPNGITIKWDYDRSARDGKTQIFNHHAKYAFVQITKGNYKLWDSKEDKINDLEHSVWITFHQLSKDSDWLNKMKLAIISFGDYVIKKDLTARFPKNGLNINHLPQ